jgi:alkylhydroperoxidase family enzyme
MAWIKTIPFEEADAALRQALEAQHSLYPKEYDRKGDASESIVSTHTLIPDALHHAFATFGALLSASLPLSRAQQEMITTHVSALNRCHY